MRFCRRVISTILFLICESLIFESGKNKVKLHELALNNSYLYIYIKGTPSPTQWRRSEEMFIMVSAGLTHYDVSELIYLNGSAYCLTLAKSARIYSIISLPFK